MTHQQIASVTIASEIDLVQFSSAAAFNYQQVIDLRCGVLGTARPIKEQILKRLRYLFIDYTQMPLAFSEVSEDRKHEVINTIRSFAGTTLVLTDDIAKLADLCMQSDLPFMSNELYVVESALPEPVVSVTRPHMQHAATAG